MNSSLTFSIGVMYRYIFKESLALLTLKVPLRGTSNDLLLVLYCTVHSSCITDIINKRKTIPRVLSKVQNLSENFKGKKVLEKKITWISFPACDRFIKQHFHVHTWFTHKEIVVYSCHAHIRGTSRSPFSNEKDSKLHTDQGVASLMILIKMAIWWRHSSSFWRNRLPSVLFRNTLPLIINGSISAIINQVLIKCSVYLVLTTSW